MEVKQSGGEMSVSLLVMLCKCRQTKQPHQTAPGVLNAAKPLLPEQLHIHMCRHMLSPTAIPPQPPPMPVSDISLHLEVFSTGVCTPPVAGANSLCKCQYRAGNKKKISYLGTAKPTLRDRQQPLLQILRCPVHDMYIGTLDLTQNIM